MIKAINRLLYFSKLILLLVSFGFTLYIIMFMYQRLEKSMLQSIWVFLPYLLLFVLFSINIIFNQKQVRDNFFYNFVCCLTFVLFIYVGYRAVFDPYMVARIRLGYDINFNYYSDMISPLQIMLYCLSIANVCFMFLNEKKTNDHSVVTKI